MSITMTERAMITSIPSPAAALLGLCLALLGLSGVALSGTDEGYSLEPAAIAIGRFSYLTELQVGGTAMEIESVREIALDTVRGTPSLRIETISVTGMGETIDRLQLNAESLYPLERDIVQGDGRLQLLYEKDRVTGLIHAAGQTITVNLALTEPAYAGDAGLDTLLAALPLQAGLSGRLQIIETDVEVYVQAFHFSVGEAGITEVPAGSFEAWPIEVQAIAEPDYRQTIWLTVAVPRRFVLAEAPVPLEAGGGTLITRLTGIKD